MIRILIADDHQLIREGLKKLLKEEHDMTVVGEAGQADDVFKIVRENEVDIVLLDISMPGRSGLEVAAALRERACAAAIVFVSAHDDAEFIEVAQAAGALGYVFKPRLSSDLPEAVRAASAGRRFFPSRS